MNMNPLSISRALCVVSVLSMPCAAAESNVKNEAVLPPPGLYRVDIDGTIQLNRGDRQSILQRDVVDGANGNETLSGGRVGETPVIKSYSGEGPLTQCITAQQTSKAFLPPGTCKRISAAIVPGREQSTGSCDGLKFNVTYSRIDNKTWEGKAVIQQSGVPMSNTEPPYITAHRRTLTTQARDATTAAARTEALSQLAQLETVATEMKKAASEQAAAQSKLKNGPKALSPIDTASMPLEYTVITRLTRIADECTGSSKK